MTGNETDQPPASDDPLLRRRRYVPRPPHPRRGPTPRLAALAGNVAHDNECYGSIAVYLRLKGIVPPSSEPRH